MAGGCDNKWTISISSRNILFAVLGWSYEVILETFIYQWGFTNRGVLFGIWSRSNVLFALSWEIDEKKRY